MASIKETEHDISWGEYEELFKKRTFKKPVEMNELENIKRKKITKDNNITFSDVNKMNMPSSGEETQLRYYAEEEFFAYMYYKQKSTWPDVLEINGMDGNGFIADLFKYTNISETNNYKKVTTSRAGRKKIEIESMLLVFNIEGKYDIFTYINDSSITMFYNKIAESLDAFKDLYGYMTYYKTKDYSKNKIFVVYMNNGNFDKKAFDIKKINVNLEENYNDDFVLESNEIVKGLNDKKKSNLVILRGDPGTGKSTYIRYLTHKLKKNIIFISPSMVHNITAPAFIPFLMDNNNSVLVIEDAEPVLEKRDGSGRSDSVSNILNLTDGLLSDCLNISILTTINTKSKNIDDALLRKGRLLKTYNFEKLNTEKSKKLLKKLGRGDVEVKEPMTLADIYFYEEDNGSKKEERRKVGF